MKNIFANKTESIPSEFQAFLPSSNISNLDIEKDKYYILENLLHNSNMEGWKWMWKVYGPENIEKVVKESRNLDAKDVKIWQYYLNIPENQILCLQTNSQKMRKKYWM